MTIQALNGLTMPSRSQDNAFFIAAMDAFLAALPQFQTDANALAAALSSIAAGTAYAIPYVFSTTTTDADPGAGFLRLSSATQNASTVIRTDLTGADGTDWTSVLDTFDASTSTIKGQIRIVKLSDPTKWLTFSLTARATPTGYRNLTVVNIGGSSTSPFVNGDAILLMFTSSGDKGSTGPAGSLIRRVSTITSSSTPTPNANTDDMFTVTALAAAATFGAPTGTPVEGQGLLIRVKDNGTARALAYNTIYRASSDLALPSTTIINKTLYIGFVYNGADSKWDLIAVLNNL